MVPAQKAPSEKMSTLKERIFSKGAVGGGGVEGAGQNVPVREHFFSEGM